ncbi:MAG: SCO family protein [Pseudomonadota bacterium]
MARARRRARSAGAILVLAGWGTMLALAHDLPEPRPATPSPTVRDAGPTRGEAFDFDPPEPGTYGLPPIGLAADGEVIDARGGRHRLRSLFEDKFVVLSFIYTRCADACPLATAVLSDVVAASRRDEALRANLKVISLSFDPEHDRPQIMAEYARAMAAPGPPDWLFLTTASQSAVRPILSGYGQSLTKVPRAEDPGGFDFIHLLRVYLIDRGQRIRNVYSAAFLDPRLILADLRTLLIEERGGAK